ncbi:hypothetical protein ACWD26_43065 [Streptomyces sp. NPDC002787]
MNAAGPDRYTEHSNQAVRHLEAARVWNEPSTAEHLKAAEIEATLAHAEALRTLAAAMTAQQTPNGTVNLPSHRSVVLPD